MDIFDYLKLDHQKIKHLIHLYEHTDEISYKAEIIPMLMHELNLHETAKQAIFYQFLSKHLADKNLIHQATTLQNDIQKLISQIINLDGDYHQTERLFSQLKHLITQQIKEEENNLFKQAKEAIPDQEAYILKEQMHDYKEKLQHAKTL